MRAIRILLLCALPLACAACGPIGIGVGIYSLFDDSIPPTINTTEPVVASFGATDHVKLIEQPGSNGAFEHGAAIRDRKPDFFIDLNKPLSDFDASRTRISLTRFVPDDEGGPVSDVLETTVEVIDPDKNELIRPKLPLAGRNAVDNDGDGTPDVDAKGDPVGLMDGVYVLEVDMTDKAGNALFEQFEFTIDRVPPNPPVPIGFESNGFTVTASWVQDGASLTPSQRLLGNCPDVAGSDDTDVVNYEVYFVKTDDLDSAVKAGAQEPEQVLRVLAPAQAAAAGGEVQPLVVKRGIANQSGNNLTISTLLLPQKLVAYTYGIVAVDRAGNRSCFSALTNIKADPTDGEMNEPATKYMPSFGVGAVSLASASASVAGQNYAGGAFVSAQGMTGVYISRQVGVDPVTGQPVFAQPPDIFFPPTNAPAIETIRFVDINGDPDPDLITANKIQSPSERAELGIYLGTGDPQNPFAFQTSLMLRKGYNPAEVFDGDLNRDAYKDLMVRGAPVPGVVEPGDLLFVFLGKGDNGAGDGFNEVPGEAALGIEAVQATFGSFNGDTYQDFAATDGTVVRVLFGMGSDDPTTPNVHNGVFGTPALVAPNGGPRFIGAGDFLCDGVEDLVSSNADGTISVTLAGKGGVFGVPMLFPVAASPAVAGAGPVAVADFNNDNILDVAVADAVPGTLSMLLGGGTDGRWDGTFRAPIETALGLSAPVSMEPVDLNNDGVLDLSILTATGSFTVIGKGGFPKAAGAFTSTPVYLQTAEEVADLQIFDANMDGLTDIVAAGRRTGIGLHTLFAGQGLFGIGLGTFDAPVTGGTDEPALQLAHGDFNRDGLPDLAVATASGLDVQFGGFNSPFRFLRDRFYTTPDPITRAIAGDFNHDGVLDLAVLSAFPSVDILLGTNNDGVTDGTFGLENRMIADLYGGEVDEISCGLTNYTPLFDNLAKGLRYEKGLTTPTDIFAADFDGDGGLDILVNEQAARALVILRNFGRDCGTPGTTPAAVPDRSGFGIFEAGVSFGLPFTPAQVLVDDFDKDGVPDVIALAANPTAASEAFCIMFGDRSPVAAPGLGGFSFKPPVPYLAGDDPAAIAIADVNQDGFKDIAILDADDGKLRILLGKSDSTFDAANPIVIQVVAPTNMAALPLTSVAFGDFNSDRIVDIAVGGRDGVRVYLGDRVP